MPLTFLAHQAPVLPLKMRWPQLFDGTALVVGSMMPDLLFLTYGTGIYIDAHRPWPQLWLCLPLTMAITIAVKRRVAGSLGPHLPDRRAFGLRDYARLSAWPLPRSLRAWLILTSSALIGSFSHLALDAFTHSWGYAVEHVAVLRLVPFTLPTSLPGPLGGYPVHVYTALQFGLTAILSVVTLWLAHRIADRRRLLEWYPDAVIPEPTVVSRRRLVVGVVAGAATGAAIAVAGWAVGTGHGLLFLVVDSAGLGLVLASGWARAAMTEPATGSEQDRAA